MKCKKCAKEYSDEFAFCPFCGTKKPTDKAAPCAPLIFSLPVLTDEQLEMLASDLQGKSGEEIRAVLQKGEYPATVYAVRGQVEIERTGKWRLKELMKTTPWLSEEPWSNVRFFVEERPYTKHMFQYVGRSVFRLKEDAESAIHKAGYTRGEGGYWYAEEDDDG